MSKQNCERDVITAKEPSPESPRGEHLKESNTSSDRARDEVRRQTVVRRQYPDEPDDGGCLAV
jgi:hypothetical protein